MPHDRLASDAPAQAGAAPRYRWRLAELSGALGDLGTFLPHIVGAITVVGMSPVGILFGFGFFYIASAAFYGLPMSVQPMKAASAAVLVTPMAPGAVAGGGLVIGALFLVAGLSGAITRIARIMPPVVAAGLQLGLGLSLAVLGVGLAARELWLGVATSLLMLILLKNRAVPAALPAVAFGVAAGQLTGGAPPLPELMLGLHLPHLVIPTWDEVVHGALWAVLPQIPLTLTNAVIVCAAVCRDLYPARAARASERNLAITQGLGNMIAAPFGGYMMCHGAGGVVAHHLFGGRTAAATTLIGGGFVVLAVLLGDGAYGVLRLIPEATLGAMLAFSGLELAASSRPQRFEPGEVFILLAMAVVAVAANPAAAFAVGFPLAVAVRRGWLRL